jgi:hypothetical protein
MKKEGTENQRTTVNCGDREDVSQCNKLIAELVGALNSFSTF